MKLRENIFSDKRFILTNVIKSITCEGSINLSNVCYFTPPQKRTIDFDLHLRCQCLFLMVNNCKLGVVPLLLLLLLLLISCIKNRYNVIHIFAVSRSMFNNSSFDKSAFL